MSYQVLARKWRPRCFAEMVGQAHVVRALSNALARNQLHHAYLFTGTRGVGKTTLARIFAKSLNCADGVTPEPCGVCSACQEIDAGRFMDLLEVDAASRTKVDQTRELLDNVPYAPVRGRYKVYLIDEVHMFSNNSFNALLKTLEEPPPHVKFLLATTDPQKVPVTVLSRCLQFNLKRLPTMQIRAQLAHILEREGIDHGGAALTLLAQAADGSMRDGLSLLDQAIAFSSGRVDEADVRVLLGTLTQDLLFDLVEALAWRDAAAVLNAVGQMAERAPDFADVLKELLGLLHRVAVAQAVPDLLGYASEVDPRERELVSTLTAEDVQLYYQIGLLGQRDLDWAPDPRSGLEMIMLRMLAFRPDAARQPVETPARPAVAISPTIPIPLAGLPVTVKSSVPAPESNTPPRLVDANDWHVLVGQLGLQAITQQLAAHSQLDSWDGRVLGLLLDPAAEGLRVPVAEKRLLNALQARLGAAMRLEWRVAHSEAETPARRALRHKEEWQHSAHQRLNTDPMVRALRETFDAELLPDSIRATQEP